MRTIINALIVGGLVVSGSMPPAGDELIRAVEGGNRPLLSRLIAEGADVNYVDNRGYSALIVAAGQGQADIVTTLIQSGAAIDQVINIHIQGRHVTPLLEATRSNQTDVVRILIQNGADVNQALPVSLYSPLHLAASYGDANGDSEIVSVLIESGANINAESSFSGAFSPLYAAARFANSHIVSKLIRAGADVNLMVDNRGRTALMGAACTPAYRPGFNPPLLRRQIDTISLLMQAGADINAVSDDGNTALLQAVGSPWISGVDEVVSFLIAHGANVNQETARGTPLMKAIEVGDFNKVRLLVLAGAGTGNLPENLFQEFIVPIMTSLEELVTHHSSLITMAFVRLKYSSGQTEKMFENAAFRDLFNEWDDLRIDMVSRIVSFLVTLESEDLFFPYILAPFLVNADIERLNRFGIVLSFLTEPWRNKTGVFHATDKPELFRFIKATFRSAVRSFKLNFNPIVDSMYAVYSDLKSEMGALNKAMRVIPDVHVGTVLQFRHGEFGIYSKFAENLNQLLI